MKAERSTTEISMQQEVFKASIVGLCMMHTFPWRTYTRGGCDFQERMLCAHVLTNEIYLNDLTMGTTMSGYLSSFLGAHVFIVIRECTKISPRAFVDNRSPTLTNSCSWDRLNNIVVSCLIRYTNRITPIVRVERVLCNFQAREDRNPSIA